MTRATNKTDKCLMTIQITLAEKRKIEKLCKKKKISRSNLVRSALGLKRRVTSAGRPLTRS